VRVDRTVYNPHQQIVGTTLVVRTDVPDDAKLGAGDQPVLFLYPDTVLAVETELAKACRARVDLRDPNKNYNKFAAGEFAAKTPALAWNVFFDGLKLTPPTYEIVGQPEFFDVLNTLVQNRPLSDWKTYLRWHLLHGSAPFLSSAFETENFNFYGKVLSGQPEQEPRWKRAAHSVHSTRQATAST